MDNRLLTQLEILETSPPVPANGLAVRHDLENDLKQAIKRELLNMHQSVEGQSVLKALNIEKFIEAA